MIDHLFKPIILISLLFSGLQACNSEEQAEMAVGGPETGSEYITVSRSQYKEAGMTMDTLALRSFAELIHCNGTFAIPPGKRASVSSYFGGYVKDIDLVPGKKVRKGQVLFTLENPMYVDLQEQFLDARDQLELLKSDYERQATLVKENITSEKAYLKAESDYHRMKTRFESLRKKLQLMNLDPEKVTSEGLKTQIAIFAPISGYVTDVVAYRGMFLEPTDVAVEISNIDELHLEISLFENDFQSIQLGQAIQFWIQNDPEKVYEAEVAHIIPVIDPEKRTVVLHGELKDRNNAKLFAPGIFFEATIRRNAQEMVGLPAESVGETENGQFVLELSKEEGDMLYFKKRKVTTGPSDDHYTVLENYSDFAPQSRFLVKGAFDLIQ